MDRTGEKTGTIGRMDEGVERDGKEEEEVVVGRMEGREGRIDRKKRKRGECLKDRNMGEINTGPGSYNLGDLS